MLIRPCMLPGSSSCFTLPSSSLCYCRRCSGLTIELHLPLARRLSGRLCCWRHSLSRPCPPLTTSPCSFSRSRLFADTWFENDASPCSSWSLHFILRLVIRVGIRRL